MGTERSNESLNTRLRAIVNSYAWIAYVLLLAMMIMTLVIVLYAVTQQNSKTAKNTSDIAVLVNDNKDLSIALSNQAYGNCRAIESVTKRIRQNAVKSFNDIEKNLKLLGITTTKELIAAAKKQRDETLQIYKPRECQRATTVAPVEQDRPFVPRD